MARVELVATEQTAGGTGDAVIERHDAIGTTDDPVDGGVATRAPVDIRQYCGRDPDESVALGSFGEDRLHPAGGHTTLTRGCKNTHRLAVEEQERRHRSGAASAGTRLVRSVHLIEGGGCFGHEILVRGAERLLQLGEQLCELLALELVTDGPRDEPAEASRADPALHGLDEVLLHGPAEGSLMASITKTSTTDGTQRYRVRWWVEGRRVGKWTTTLAAARR